LKIQTPRALENLAAGLKPPCLLPVVSTVDGCKDPAKMYLGLRQASESSYLLESAEGPGEAARYSVIGTNPLLHIKIKGGIPEVTGREDIVEAAPKACGKDALDFVRKTMMLGKMNVPTVASRYMLGAVGYIGYDYVRSLANIGNNTADDLHQPELEFMLPQGMVVFDHAARKTHYCSLMLLIDGSDLQEEYGSAQSALKNLMATKETGLEDGRPTKISVGSNVTAGDFEKGVTRAKRYIRAGDVIQTVLSRRIELNPAPPLGRFYMNLRRINPSPYMFFIDFPERSIVGSSPEILVKVQRKKVITRPIAGTRRRGRSKKDEKTMEKELLSDEKERAEHVMLVDLGRNDIGRVAELSSMKVTEFMKVEKYSDVQHLVSNVEGKLRRGMDSFDALRATFPAGTVTGAPKVRAMEIIEELEPTRRGIYAGAIGSFSYTGDADLAITIRTLVAQAGKGYIQVGAGIVADSVPWKEHYETENKARALLRAAGV